MSRSAKTAMVAWLVTAVYYLYQYALRSAPAVMMPQLSEAFGLTTMGVASMAGLFTFSVFLTPSSARCWSMPPAAHPRCGWSTIRRRSRRCCSGSGSQSY